MEGWQYIEMCRTCGLGDCTDKNHTRKYPRWYLKNDLGNLIAVMEQFMTGMPWYGTTIYGRTGPVDGQEECARFCELMIEQGPLTGQ